MKQFLGFWYVFQLLINLAILTDFYYKLIMTINIKIVTLNIIFSWVMVPETLQKVSKVNGWLPETGICMLEDWVKNGQQPLANM